jgi:hypothetical protein
VQHPVAPPEPAEHRDVAVERRQRIAALEGIGQPGHAAGRAERIEQRLQQAGLGPDW